MKNEIISLQQKQKVFRTLFDELTYALAKTSQDDLKAWGRQTARTFSRSTLRRGKNFVHSLKVISKFGKDETVEFLKTSFKGKPAVKQYAKDKKKKLKDALVIKKLKTQNTIKILLKALKTDPKKAAPEILIGFLGFYFGSGGLDGDGGVPDLDFVAGPGYHRSIWTHSVFSAIVIETLVLSLVNLSQIIYDKLPDSHHPFWDLLNQYQERYATIFTNAASLGIAYHLMIDMNILSSHIKPYADLPFSTTMEGHQALLGANALTEAVDVKEKNKKKDNH